MNALSLLNQWSINQAIQRSLSSGAQIILILLLADKFTEEEIEEYREAFQLFDKDGGGTVSTKELKQLLNSLFSAGSGEIDFNEFLQLMAAKQANMTMEDELRNAFNVFDKDGSGYISADELKQVMIINRSPSDGTFP
ncbi:Calmodulin [Acropora cervicornis]|uniref:Calmodulin n=1 Tax=Acropora cervicornis TaxID=6130 RepID=A0AAD9QA99_ACRCE|nr:Calmodulin [Acropora cervicornis]